MNHWLIAPLVIPLLSGALLLVLNQAPQGLRRAVSIGATLALLPVAARLIADADSDAIGVYYLGDWPAPFGIVLVLDRLSALMLGVCAILASASVLYASAGEDSRGTHFHALFQFQLLGVNGAFLTGDLFNLFVFFEVLLIASYCLLMHAPNAGRTRSALHVVLLNLTGSALFLIALGIVYATAGTLNMADLARHVASVPDDVAGLVRVGGLLLLVVFGLKAACAPLGFWLPGAYQACTASVACLFAIMTKVGIYAILRVHLLVYDDIGTTTGSPLVEPWLMPIALVTVVLGTLGLLAASSLRALVSYLVVISVGTLLAGIGLFNLEAISAALFYLVHSTFIGGGLFLLADLAARQRGDAGDRLDRAQAVAQPALLGLLFFVGAAAMAGLPPVSGFIAKVMLLQAALESQWMIWMWAVILGSGLCTVVSLSRAASALFWRTGPAAIVGAPDRTLRIAPAVLLIGCAVALVILAAPLKTYTAATAQQLLQRELYISAVLANDGVSVPASATGGSR